VILLRNRKPVLSLLILSPAIAELLSGSAPPSEFFNPLGFLFLVLFYGCGSVLIREIVKRWDKDIPSIILLGAAYGVWEEGVVVKSFFDPNWVDLGILGVYGRWLDVNWVWAFSLTIYHSIFSITIPIVLVELIFDEHSSSTWLGRKSLLLFSALFILTSILLNAFLTAYQPYFWQYALCFFLIFVLIFSSYKAPKTFSIGKLNPPSRKKLLFFGFTWTFSFFIIYWFTPYLLQSPLITIEIGILQIFLTIYYLSRFDWNNADKNHFLALIFGLLSLFMLLAPIQELDNPNRPDDTTGMSIVGVLFLIFFLFLWKRFNRELLLPRKSQLS